jgi:hypothetical protein
MADVLDNPTPRSQRSALKQRDLRGSAHVLAVAAVGAAAGRRQPGPDTSQGRLLVSETEPSPLVVARYRLGDRREGPRGGTLHQAWRRGDDAPCLLLWFGLRSRPVEVERLLHACEASLSDPVALRPTAWGNEGGGWWFELPELQVPTLEALGSTLPVRLFPRIARQLCSVVAEAHAHGVRVPYLDASQVFWVASEQAVRVVVAPFNPAALTPRHPLGWDPIALQSHRNDLWGIGLVLYFFLAGKPAPESDWYSY